MMLERYKKNIFKGLCLSALALGFNACETTELQILDNPNALAPNQADVDLFLVGIETSTANFFEAVTEEGMETTRILHMFGPTYDNAYGPGQFDGPWTTAYAGILSDIRALEPVAEEAGLYTHIGISRAIEAYVVMTLVDYFGDVPYSEAIQGTEFPNPNLDGGAAIYAGLEALLDDALVQFAREEVSGASSDLYYGGDEDQWIKLVNTLKLKLYLQTRLVDSGAGGKITALVNEGNLILDAGDDFQFNYSTTDANPDSRHPIFGRNFNVAADVADYMSNSYMEFIKDDFLTGDPRTRYYFYRQSLDFTMDPNENECITTSRPTHYSSMDTFCNPGDGYWGRDHADNDGIPPDGGLRTTWGVYPVGGLFDDERGTAIPGREIGLQGAGLSPIMLSSYTNFMLAEGALAAGVTGDARTYLEAGVRASIAKVIGVGEGLDYLENVLIADDPDTPDNEQRTVRDLYVPSSSNIEVYVTAVLDRYDAAGSDDARLDLVTKEYFKALFGNGVEAYNTYRRTGFPSDLQPTLLAQPGEFLNSYFYPNELVLQNSNASQKASQAVRVFWAEGGPTVD